MALVLGAAVLPDGTPSGFLRARLELARRLYASGNAALPRRRGCAASKVVLDHAGFDTYDSCVRASRIYGVSELIVVTQSYHLPRAVATCRRLGIRAVGVGDETARRYRSAWLVGTLRDQVACVKTELDLVSRRAPVLGPPDDSVDRALAG